MNLKTKIWLCVIVFPVIMVAGDFDAGGVTFDFEKLSKQRLADTANHLIGKNLVQNGDFTEPLTKAGYTRWQHANIMRQLQDKHIAKLILPEIDFKIASTQKGKAAFIGKSLKIQDYVKTKTMHIPGDWFTMMKVTDSDGGEYKLRFNYKGKSLGKYGGKLFVKMTFHEPGGKGNPYTNKRTGKTFKSGFCPLSNKWALFDRTVKVPPRTGWIVLTIRLYGTGELYFNNVVMKRYVPDTQLITVNLSPMAYLDNTFYFSQNNPGLMLFAWKKNKKIAKKVLQHAVFCLELPEQLSIKGVGKGATISKREHVAGANVYRIKFNNFPALIRDDYSPNSNVSLLVMQEKSAVVGSLKEGCYWLESNGVKLSIKKYFDINFMPEIAVSNRMKHFLSGIDIRGRYASFNTLEAHDIFSSFWNQTGINLVLERTVLSGQTPVTIDNIEKRLQLYRTNGIKAILQNLPYLINGYVIGPPEKRTEDVKFKTVGKASHYHVKLGVCPAAIYQKTDYFNQVVTEYLQENLSGYDGVWCNWEPFMFCGRGCFCDRCRNDFLKFSKLPADQVLALWPQKVLAGQVFNDKWKAFKCYQQGRVIKTLQNYVLSLSDKMGVIPGISWPIATNSIAGKEFSKEYDVAQYGNSIKYLNPWGPYNAWRVFRPYTYRKGTTLKDFIATQTVKNYVGKNFKPQPGLMGFTQGFQGIDYVTQPEFIAMTNMGYFLSKYRSALVYLFPVGYDNRYWQAIADSNNQIALYEKYVTDGIEVDNIKVSPVSPYPATCKRILGKWMPEMAPESLLQTVAFQLGDELFAAVGNFWEKGEVFFKLQVKDLPAAKLYMVCSPDKKITYTPGTKHYFTGRELAEGILLQAGAMRWGFWVIKPAAGRDQSYRVITAENCHNAMKVKRNSLRKQADQEIQSETSAGNHTQIKRVTNGELTARPKIQQGEHGIMFSAGSSQVFVSYKAMKVTHWNVGDNVLVSAQSNTGIGVPAFWLPAHIVSSDFAPVSLSASRTGIKVTGVHKGKFKNPLLNDLTMKQTITVSADCKKLLFDTTLTNSSNAQTGMRNIECGFRYNNLPADIQFIEFINQNEPIVFRRQFIHRIFAPENSEEVVATAKKFKIKSNYTQITENSAKLNCKASILGITVTPKNLFAGIIIGDYAILPTVTFEPLYKKVSIKPGDTIRYSQVLNIK